MAIENMKGNEGFDTGLEGLRTEIDQEKSDIIDANLEALTEPVDPKHVAKVKDILEKGTSNPYPSMIMDIVRSLNVNVSPGDLTTKEIYKNLENSLLDEVTVSSSSSSAKGSRSSSGAGRRSTGTMLFTKKSKKYKKEVIKIAILENEDIQAASAKYLMQPLVEYFDGNIELREKLIENMNADSPKQLRDLVRRDEAAILVAWMKANPVQDYAERFKKLSKSFNLDDGDDLRLLANPGSHFVYLEDRRTSDSYFDTIHLLFKAFVADAVLFQDSRLFDERMKSFEDNDLSVGGLESISYGAKTPFTGQDVNNQKVTDLLDEVTVN